MSEYEKNPWTTLRSRSIYANPWIAVDEHDVLRPDGKPGIYGVVHACNLATGALPIDQEGCVTLVGQYRYALDAYSWEIPEGGGPHDVPALETIQRELREETGLVARQWLEVARLHLSNSVSDELAISFVCWDLEQHAAEPEGCEDLRLRRLPFAQALGLVLRGEITDAISVATLLKVDALAREGSLPADLARIVLDT